MATHSEGGAAPATLARPARAVLQLARGCAVGTPTTVAVLLMWRTPRWRCLYFTGGARPDTPAGVFVADLFTRFLPADQPLAAPSFKGGAARANATSR
jgi:hypothetical protein